MTSALDDLLALVRRELGTDDVRVLERGAPTLTSVGDAGAEVVVSCALPDGSSVVARFPSPPADLAALERRLEMICASLGERAADGPGGSARPAPLRTLRDELAALAMRAGALVAFVMDAHSPVLWGIGGHERPTEEASDVYPALRSDDEAVAETRVTGAEVHALHPDAEEASIGPVDTAVTDSGGSEAANDEDLVVRAMVAVRALPATETLPRGGHVNELAVIDDWALLARSFAGIYMLVLVFDDVPDGASSDARSPSDGSGEHRAPEPRAVSATLTPVRAVAVRPVSEGGGGGVDELLARRAMLHALPTIEQLVLSLPPVDPPPAIGGQVQVRRRNRRR